MNKTSDTLKFISTHIINKNVIDEYKKLCKSGDDVILCIDNTNLNIQYDFPVCEKEFFKTKVKCFLFDINIHKKLNLPNYYFSEETDDFGKIMWYNADYRFYYVREYFPDYKYYWQFDYDIYCNGESYKPFLDKYRDKKSHLLICIFNGTLKNTEFWTFGLDWIYDDSKELYGGMFQVCRLEKSAISYLYNKRLEHAQIFKKCLSDKNSRWINCELFVPTELMNGGFICNAIVEKKITFNKHIYVGDECLNKKDDLLYHPYKGEFKRNILNIFGIKLKWLSPCKS